VEGQPRSPRKLFWLLQTAGWLLVMPVSASMSFLIFQDIHTIFFFSVVRQVMGFGLTLGLWQLYRRWPAANFSFYRHGWQIALGCFAAAAVDVLLTQAWLGYFHLSPLPEVIERGTLFSRLALYVAWSALYFAIRQELESRSTELRLARAEAANREAELQRLRAQMNPHFLFNALGSIITQAETNPGAIAATTHAVADYLRYTLTHSAHEAPLGEELAAMSSYLRVESATQGPERLDWRIEASDAARLAVVPTALVQPLIENALKYGFRTSPLPLRLRVEARVQATELVITVENSGRWISREPGEKAPDSTGIGLVNLRRRLELLCRPAARLETISGPDSVRVEVRLPFVVPA
jgi:hypothetical protein